MAAATMLACFCYHSYSISKANLLHISLSISFWRIEEGIIFTLCPPTVSYGNRLALPGASKLWSVVVHHFSWGKHVLQVPRLELCVAVDLDWFNSVCSLPDGRDHCFSHWAKFCCLCLHACTVNPNSQYLLWSAAVGTSTLQCKHFTVSGILEYVNIKVNIKDWCVVRLGFNTQISWAVSLSVIKPLIFLALNYQPHESADWYKATPSS